MKDIKLYDRALRMTLNSDIEKLYEYLYALEKRVRKLERGGR